MIQNGVQEAEAILVGQIQNGVDHREVHSALERAVIGDLLLEDAQNGHHQRDGIEEGEPGGGQAHDGIQTEAGDDGGNDGDDHDQNLVGQLAVGGSLIEVCHCGDLADGGGEAGQHHGQAQTVNRDLAAAGADDRQQEVGVADAVGLTGAVADSVAVGVVFTSAVGAALFTGSVAAGVATFFFFMPVTVTLTFPNVLFFFLPFFKTSFTVTVAFPALIPVTFPFDVTFATCLLLLVKE